MARRFTIAQFRPRFRRMRKEIDRVALPTIRRFIGQVRKASRTGLMQTPLGRALWVRRRRASHASNPPLVLKTIRASLSRTQRAWIGGIKIKGLAANIALGIPTGPHVIRARNKSHLVFRTRTGVIRTRSVDHPGSHIAKRPIPQNEIKKVVPDIEKVMSNQMNNLYARILR